MKKKYCVNIGPIIIVFAILISIVCIVLILSKVLNDTNQSKSKNDMNNQEVIRVISEDNTMMIDNVSIEKRKFKEYLVFEVVRLDKNIKNIKFDISLLYDGDLVYKKNVIINNFNNEEYIKKEIELNDFKYDFDDLSVDLKIYK